MSYGTDGLTFRALREANLKRIPQFKNKRGGRAHRKADGSDWKLSAWSNACLGELGEAAGIVKKIERGDFTLEQARPALAKELADVVTYLDIFAQQAGINLGEATITKFNEISHRVKSTILLRADGSDWEYDHARIARNKAARKRARKCNGVWRGGVHWCSTKNCPERKK